MYGLSKQKGSPGHFPGLPYRDGKLTKLWSLAGLLPLFLLNHIFEINQKILFQLFILQRIMDRGFNEAQFFSDIMTIAFKMISQNPFRLA
ncbi:hypothetical protein D3C73_1543160 [compost metagenome]